MTRSIVVGAGSIGSRHLSVLSGLGHDVAVVSSREQPGFTRYASVAAAVDAFAPEYVVVATETARHAAVVEDLTAAGFTGLLLVEKPLAVQPSALGAFSRVGVGFNLRFHPVLARLADLLTGATIHTVEVYAGQALSGWRPDRPVAAQYSAHSSRGGGVLRDLSTSSTIWAGCSARAAGVFARGGRLAEVTVDADDAWGLVAEYDRSPLVTLQLNYLDSRTRRRIVAITSAGTIEADLIAGTVVHDAGAETFHTARDDSYIAMHERCSPTGTRSRRRATPTRSTA